MRPIAVAGKTGTWLVDLDRRTCTCPDFEHRRGLDGSICKHVRRLLEERGMAEEPTVIEGEVVEPEEDESPAPLPTHLDPRFVVLLKGRAFPTYAGVLDLAHQAGLQSLTTRVLQFPDKENGGVAIVEATATFKGGRVFVDVGDCGPLTTSPQLAPAALRLASTRAKGRVLRDASNVGTKLLEEVGPIARAAEAGHRQPDGAATRPATAAAAQQATPKPGAAKVCAEKGCGRELTGREVGASYSAVKAFYCAEHLAEVKRKIAANPAV